MRVLPAWLVGLPIALFLGGCAMNAQDSSSRRSQEARPSQTREESHPTRLENCLTAVGADRTRCSATN
jgi:hypothetical protein